MTDTQDDCRKKNEFKPSPYVLRSYAKDMDKDTRLIDGDIAPYLRKVAAWIEQQNASRPSAAGDELERIAKKWAWGLAEASNAALAANARADGETFVAAINAIQNETIAAMQPAQPDVEGLVRRIQLRIENNEDENEGLHGLKGAFESGRSEGLDDAITIIRKWANKEA